MEATILVKGIRAVAVRLLLVTAFVQLGAVDRDPETLATAGGAPSRSCSTGLQLGGGASKLFAGIQGMQE